MASTHLAVLGSPIEHSKSPAIHTAAYHELGLDWDYGRYRVESNELGDFLRLRDSSWRGLSLTMPLKETAFNISTPSCPVASETGVVNTLLHTDNGWEGYNTDSFGIQKAISETTELVFENVNIFGSGATAKSAISAVRNLYPNAAVSVYARKSTSILGVKTQSLEELETKILEGLTISTFPGHLELGNLKTLPNSFVLDVAYEPWPSKLSKSWPMDNRISGIEMLLWQALIQVRIFVNGDGTVPLENEDQVFAAMSNAVKQP